MKINELKQFETVKLPNGGAVKARGMGREYLDALAEAVDEYRAQNGLPSSEEIRQAALADSRVKSGSMKFYEVMAESALPSKVDSELALRTALDRTFGGFSGFEDANGNPIPDRDSAGVLIEANCFAVLAIDEAFYEWALVRDRLSATRQKKFEVIKGKS